MCFGRSKIWKGNITQLQQQISTISRVVIHPKYRNIGLGTKLIQKTLAQAGTPCVETIAVMARYNSFFEKAGMHKTAESKPSKHVTTALQQLETLGFDIALLASAHYNEQVISKIGHENVSAVLQELSRKDASLRRRLVGLRSVYPKHEEFVTKICKLNAAGLAKALKRLSFMAQSKVYLFWRKKETF
jgi:tRNA(Met) C34 N-acetyltransferase TmcA